MIALVLALNAPAATPEAYDAVTDVAIVLGAILKDHLSGESPQTLAKRAIDGMLKGLDPWSRRAGKPQGFGQAKRLLCIKDRGVLRLRVPRFDGAWAGRWLKECPGLSENLPILIDLRGNPGGRVDDALALADLFIAGGDVLVEEKRGQAPQNHRARPSTTRFASLTILIDGGTASAAEVIAAALRARVGATLLGSQTMGKGTVQRPLYLSDGSVVLLTTGRLRLPSGQPLDGQGVRPDSAMPPAASLSACLRSGRKWTATGCEQNANKASKRIP